jgi:hypothetical protein
MPAITIPASTFQLADQLIRAASFGCVPTAMMMPRPRWGPSKGKRCAPTKCGGWLSGWASTRTGMTEQQVEAALARKIGSEGQALPLGGGRCPHWPLRRSAATMVCYECAGAHAHHDARRRVWVAQQRSFWPVQRVSVHCSNYSPRDILTHFREDLCFGL